METSLKEQFLELDGANKFLMAHCEERLAEIAKGYHGATHAVNRALAEYADCYKACEELRERCDCLEKNAAAIGKLQEQVAELEEAMEKSRKAYGELRKERTSC